MAFLTTAAFLLDSSTEARDEHGRWTNGSGGGSIGEKQGQRKNLVLVDTSTSDYKK